MGSNINETPKDTPRLLSHQAWTSVDRSDLWVPQKRHKWKFLVIFYPFARKPQWTDFREILHRPSRRGQRWQILVIGSGVWILRGGEILQFPIDSPVAVNTGLALRSTKQQRSPWYFTHFLYPCERICVSCHICEKWCTDVDFKGKTGQFLTNPFPWIGPTNSTDYTSDCLLMPSGESCGFPSRNTGIPANTRIWLINLYSSFHYVSPA